MSVSGVGSGPGRGAGHEAGGSDVVAWAWDKVVA